MIWKWPVPIHGCQDHPWIKLILISYISTHSFVFLVFYHYYLFFYIIITYISSLSVLLFWHHYFISFGSTPPPLFTFVMASISMLVNSLIFIYPTAAMMPGTQGNEGVTGVLLFYIPGSYNINSLKSTSFVL